MLQGVSQPPATYCYLCQLYITPPSCTAGTGPSAASEESLRQIFYEIDESNANQVTRPMRYGWFLWFFKVSDCLTFSQFH